MAALGEPGRHAVMPVAGATEAAVCRASVKHGRGPTLSPGDMVVRDHVAAPQAVGLQQLLARRRARRLALPPDAPAWAPSEPGWSKGKTPLRQAKARPRQALDTALTAALAIVTEADARGWFRPCGYALQ